MRPLRGLGRGGSLYVLAVLLAAAALVPLSWLLHPLTVRDLPMLLFLGILTQVAALMPIRWSRGILTVDTLPLTAAGLMFPGAGVALVSWLCTFDGRRPSPETPVWRLASARARATLEHGTASIVVAALPVAGLIALPSRTLAYTAVLLAINYPLVARMFAYIENQPFRAVLSAGLRQSSIQSVLLLVFGGGILSVLLQNSDSRLMSIAVLGFIFAIRANIADAQRQAEAKLQTLKLAAQALDARDRYTESHSQRVSELSVQLGQAMGLAGRDLERLGVGGTLHDIGKIGIPDAILNKRGPLSPFEWAIMRRHPDLGADMILGHSALAEVASMVRHHHERWDGSGYPAGLEGEEIPLGGRILAVADSYDTITRIRVYRRTLLTAAEAVDDISRLAGSWYDRRVVDALRAMHGREPLTLPGLAADQRPASVATGLGLLRHNPRFRRLALASGISSLGDPLTTVAILVAVFATTRSPLLVAGTYAAKAAATLLLGGALAGLSDRFDRRRLISLFELVRAAALVATPSLLGLALGWIFPVVFVLAAAESVVTPAREAATPELVRPGELRAANAVLGAVNTSAQVIGFPLAGLILLADLKLRALFWLGGLTFLLAGLVILSVGAVGGAATSRPLLGGVRTAWATRAARPLLLVAAAGAFFISMTLPSLIALAYQMSSRGAQAYTLLELALSLGVVLGNVILWRLSRLSSGRLMGLGLGLTGLLSLGIAASGWLLLTALLLLLASVGNAWYVVANRTALQERGRSESLGSLMATRFTLGNLMVIAGSALGGWLAAALGPRYVYALIGAGLTALAGVAGVLFAGGEPRRARLEEPGLAAPVLAAPETTLPAAEGAAPAAFATAVGPREAGAGGS